MSNPSTALIQELRQRTRASLALIRKALAATNDDVAAAEAYINNHPDAPKPNAGLAGLIVAGTHQGRIGALVEVRCGTDFVARTDEFQALCRELLLQALGTDDEGPLAEQAYVRDPGRKVAEVIAECAGKVGETVTVTRHVRWTL